MRNEFFSDFMHKFGRDGQENFTVALKDKTKAKVQTQTSKVRALNAAKHKEMMLKSKNATNIKTLSSKKIYCYNIKCKIVGYGLCFVLTGLT